MDQGPPQKTIDTETYRGESGESLKDMGTGEKFLNRTPMAWAVRSRIDKWDLIKLQSFCKAKDTVINAKSQPRHWEKFFTNPTSDRGLIFNIQRTQQVRLQRTK